MVFSSFFLFLIFFSAFFFVYSLFVLKKTLSLREKSHDVVVATASHPRRAEGQ